MPCSRQNARTSRSQPVRAKQRFCTNAGVRAAAAELLELIEGDVADAEEARRPARVQLLHRAPDFAVASPGRARDGPCSTYESIDSTSRCSSELANDCRTCVAGRRGGRTAADGPARRVGELRLQEQLVARHEPVAIRGDRRAHAGLEVVPALIGGVDGAEAGLERLRVRRSVSSSFQAVP